MVSDLLACWLKYGLLGITALRDRQLEKVPKHLEEISRFS